MLSPLDHPWINDHDFEAEYRDSIRVAMKSSLAMLESDAPPTWIVIFDEWAMWYRARTRVVVDGFTTMDVEGSPVDRPTSTLLTDRQTCALTSLLKGLKQDSFFDVVRAVLDGTSCVVSVINGVDGWCAFSQFNSCGLDPNDWKLPGPQIAALLRSYYQGLG